MVEDSEPLPEVDVSINSTSYKRSDGLLSLLIL